MEAIHLVLKKTSAFGHVNCIATLLISLPSTDSEHTLQYLADAFKFEQIYLMLHSEVV